MKAPTIALLTDFGTEDIYVGVMKGVIARAAPEARVIDLTHEIPPGDVAQAAFRLWQAAPYFPKGTIFLCVVDPGVGGPRKGVAISWPDRSCVGPDNGLFTYLLMQDDPLSVIELRAEKFAGGPISATFHGRDVFAPAAAQLARGKAHRTLGEPLDRLNRLSLPCLEWAPGGRVRGELLFPDRFGNWATSLGRLHAEAEWVHLRPWLPGIPETLFRRESLKVRVGDRLALGLRMTFGEVPPGDALAYIGSDGLLEIGIHRGSAAEMLSLQRGMTIEIGE